jgi:hypothetical protein
MSDTWTRADPPAVTAARLRLADRTLRGWLGDQIESPRIADAAVLARRAAEAADPLGRPLFAAYTSLAWPEDPHLVLWHGATLLREHRGDGHVSALVTEQIDGCEANVLTAASGVSTSELQRASRQWPEDEWDAAVERLRGRGWIQDGATLTSTGAAGKQRVEDRTDALAAPPLTVLDEAERQQLLRLLTELSRSILDAGDMTFPNPIGLPDARVTAET